MAAETPKPIIPRPEVLAAVAKMPPPRPEQIARLRQILDGFPALVEASVRAHHPELADLQPRPAA